MTRRRTNPRRGSAATVSAVAALALTAGLAVPSLAQTLDPDPGNDATALTTSSGNTAAGAAGAAGKVITLVTGDRVVLDGHGEVTGLMRAEGRDDVPVRVGEEEGATYVIPRDAQPLIADGSLDRRLFNVTELSREQYDTAEGLPLIVTYEEGARPNDTPADLFAAGDAPEVTAELESINGEAMTVAPDDTAATWQAFTGHDRPDDSTRAAAPGVESIALDAVVRASLDESVRQIGAPRAWDAGYEGAGTTIAVLDTGISSNHEDVSEQVVAEQNFSSAADTEDHFGHGTHVASTAAGTGAHSNGRYTGVAPGAELLNGKVLDDLGFGTDSDIIRGMEWAVEQGADIVNMSLGGIADPTGIDPMEEAVNTLSAESGTLFVVAAGNSGAFGPGTIDSPGTADAALTVGAVDKSDQLADFSSIGPRTRDGAIKPDVTAPGVAIAAAAAPGSVVEQEGAPVADGYVSLDGTSMAAPHTAGAAALLLQQHPGWTGERLKGALVASAQPGDHPPFEQGAGRIDVPTAMDQPIVADQASLNFGLAEWPHGDDEPITRELTYRNLGEEDVTLQLTAEATDPRGEPAPSGMFTLGADQVTVPAGGSATVEVTADTTVPRLDGAYLVTLTTTGGEQTVRTSGTVHREVESYDLTVHTTGRNGAPSEEWWIQLVDAETGEWIEFTPETATSMRVPAGDYLVDATIFQGGEDATDPAGLDWLVQPRMSLTEDATLTFDARDAEPIDVTVPDARAEMSDLNMTTTVSPAGGGGGDIVTGWYAGPVPQGMRTALLGELPEDWRMTSAVGSIWHHGDRGYHTAAALQDGFYTGLSQHVTRDALARVTVDQGSSLPGSTGVLFAADSFTGISTMAYSYEPTPRTRELFLQADTGAGWEFTAAQADAEGDAAGAYFADPAVYEAGQRYHESFGVGVFGPMLREGDGLLRTGDTIGGRVNPLADGAGHEGGGIPYTSASTTRYRDGEEYATADGVIDAVEFQVPADEAEYKLVTTLSRDGAAANVSSEVTASYSFASAHPGEGEVAELPASAIRFAPDLAPDSTGPANQTVTVPVTVQGAGGALTVSASYDSGETWHEIPVSAGTIEIPNPPAGGTVSFRATVTDPDGNATTQTIIDAYRTT
ncbi:S8 family serine peptidase [Streptomyces sp. B6B3]|uniref:S8 family serine peptidase n=1 Tax=Streptomyces sp. B6B3 TaxID=3153570 RepID=UPI00325EDFFE